MALEERFTYQVVPKKPIRNLIKSKIIIKPTTLSLSKSEVLYCLKHGSVYRKFYLESSDNMEKVTPSNLDRLHRSKHINEEEYKNTSSDMSDKTVLGLDNTSSSTEKTQPEEDVKNDEVQSEETVEIKKAEEEQLSTDNELILAESEDIDDSDNVDSEKISESENIITEDNNSHPKRSKKKNRNKHKQQINNSETSSVPMTANEEN